MAEVERVHGTYSSTFGHEFRNRVAAAGQDRRRGSGQGASDEKPTDADTVELHEEGSDEPLRQDRVELEPEGHLDLNA